MTNLCARLRSRCSTRSHANEGDDDARNVLTQALLSGESREERVRHGGGVERHELYTEPPFAVLQRAYSSQVTVQ